MKKLIYSAVLMLNFFESTAYSQNQDSVKSTINIGVNLMSRYVWRGLDFGASPSIQPYIEYANKSGFTIGSWGAVSTRGNYSEVDLYAKYTLKGFSLIGTDYFFPTDGIPTSTSLEFYKYKKGQTGHLIEGSLQYKGGDNFPISLLVGTILHGADLDVNGKQHFSTYAKLGYTVKCCGNKFDTFIGMTPTQGLYGSSFGVVNLGLAAYKAIKISDKFDLPLKASLITNPQTSNIFLVVGITF
jgi:hypothetical protein